MNLRGQHYILNVGNIIVDVAMPDPTFDYEGPGVNLPIGQGRELQFHCTDVCNPGEYPSARQGNSVITFDGTEYVGDVVRRFTEYQASKGLSAPEPKVASAAEVFRGPTLELFSEKEFGNFAHRAPKPVRETIDIGHHAYTNSIVFVKTRNTNYVFLNRNGKIRGQAYKIDSTVPSYLAMPTNVQFHSLVGVGGHMVFTPIEDDGRTFAARTITTSRVEEIASAKLQPLESYDPQESFGR